MAEGRCHLVEIERWIKRDLGMISVAVCHRAWVNEDVLTRTAPSLNRAYVAYEIHGQLRSLSHIASLCPHNGIF